MYGFHIVEFEYVSWVGVDDELELNLHRKYADV